ncbi:MAG: N-acetyltransferase [Clostridiales bacterium]|nr:N-acetyltransferase [Clostridiales bacterium]
MIGTYETCPRYENEKYMKRMLLKDDKEDILKVYSDEKAVALFNSDNCGGDDFHYTTEDRMEQAIAYWLWEYDRKGFVRWTIVSKTAEEAIGTIELFNRKADDYFNNCGLLRLDLRSDYEREQSIFEILSLIVPSVFELFQCRIIATKIPPLASERKLAITRFGFAASEEKLIGHDQTIYTDYYVLQK